MIDWGLNPAWFLLAAGIVALVLNLVMLRKVLILGAALFGIALMFLQEMTGLDRGIIELGNIALVTFRFDGLSRIFALIFLIATVLNTVYAWQEDNRLTDAMSAVYAAAAVGAVLAGDFLTLFIFWEVTALSSVFLIWASGTRQAYEAGLRYLALQVTSGVLLLTGALAIQNQTGTLSFDAINPQSIGGLLVLIAFGIKAGFPLLHSWLPDAYPKATATGAVVLSAFTTKLAIYALARGFAGYEPLIVIGVVMAVFYAFMALNSDDLRRVLAYALANQLGFMIVGIGVGTTMAINGAAGHAFVSVLYTGLLFMTMGAILMRTGTAKASELGGLHRTMPITAVMALVGGLTIASLPFTGGFVAKAYLFSAIVKDGHYYVWMVLLFASAAAVLHTTLRVGIAPFFGVDRGLRPAEAPGSMLLAMTIAALLCLLLGLNPGFVYRLYPDVAVADYNPYTLDHIITQFQLVVAALFVAALAGFVGLNLTDQGRSILDTDWLYRRLGFGVVRWMHAMFVRLAEGTQLVFGKVAAAIDAQMHALFAPSGALNRAVPSAVLAGWTALILAATLLIAFLAGA
jgi:multicomponent Na+:H+ antiporter subunit D